MDKQDCSYYKSMKSWEASLEKADKNDAEHIEYLRNKYETAKAIVERREYMGIYK